MTKITTYNRGIIIDGHADTKEECETITLLCNSLAKDENFKQVAYDDGYAAFERVGHTEELKFAPGVGSFSIYDAESGDKVLFVNSDATVTVTYSGKVITFTANGGGMSISQVNSNYVETYDSDTAETLTATMKNTIESLVMRESSAPSDYDITFAASSKLSVDLTTLSGWSNLSPGNHTIKIVAKGAGYRDSEKSAGVSVTKAASIPALADATWEQINEVSQAGTASTYWSVGDEKTITLTTGEQVTLQILGFNHDDLADGSGKAGITFGMKNLLATRYKMNNNDSNAGGWNGSAMRTSTMTTLLSQCPSDLQSIIKQVSKKTSAGNKSTSIITSTDKLFLLAIAEIFSSTAISSSSKGDISSYATTYNKEGTQYQYYANLIGDKVAGTTIIALIKKLANGTGNSTLWYTRSANIGSKVSFWAASSDINIPYPTDSDGVCFGFCV